MNSPNASTTEGPQVSLPIFNNVSFWVADQVDDKDMITNDIRTHGGRICDTMDDSINMALVPEDITSDTLESILSRGISPISIKWVAASLKDNAILPIEPYLVRRSQSVVPNLECSREPDSQAKQGDRATSHPPEPPVQDSVPSLTEVDRDSISEASVARHLATPLTAQTSVPPETENADGLRGSNTQQADESLSEPEDLNETSLDSPLDASEKRAYFEYAGSKRYLFTDADRIAMRKYLEKKGTRASTTGTWDEFAQTPEGSHRSSAGWAHQHYRHPSVNPPGISLEESAIEDDDEQDLDEALSSVSSQYDTDLDEPPMVSTSGPSPVKEDDVEVLIAALRKAPPGRIKPIFWKRLAARAPQHNHTGWNRMYYSNTPKYDTPAGRDLSHSRPLIWRNEYTPNHRPSQQKTAEGSAPRNTPYTDREVELLTEFICRHPWGTNIPASAWEAFAAENPRHTYWSWRSKYYNQRAEFDAVWVSAANDNDDDRDGTKVGSVPNERSSFDKSPSKKHPRPDDDENGFRPKRKLFPNSKLNDMIPSTTPRKSTPLTILSSRGSPSTSTVAHKSPTESTARNQSRLERFPPDDVADVLNWVIRQPRPTSERDVVLSWTRFAEQRGDGIPPSHWLTIYYTDRKRFEEVEGIAARR